jgi:hypothetical protein
MLKYNLRKKIGNQTHNFVVEGTNLFELINETKKLSFPDVVECCGICQSDNLSLNSRIAKDKFKYVFIECGNCRATLNFGQKMDDPTIFYLRKNEQKEYDWKEYMPSHMINSSI